jgi:hypothetical protein
MKRLVVAAGALAVFLTALSTQHSALSQEPKDKQKTMTIRWYGQSFFQVEDSAGHKFAFDPHAIPAFGRVPVKANFVIVSHTHDDHAMTEMIDTGKIDPKTKEFVRIAETDVIRGVVEPKPGRQEWKTID